MAPLKVYLCVNSDLIHSVYATLSHTDIAQLCLSYDITCHTPSEHNRRYSFTPSNNPVDMVMEVFYKDYSNIISELKTYTDVIPWGDFGLEYANTPSDFIALAKDIE